MGLRSGTKRVAVSLFGGVDFLFGKRATLTQLLIVGNVITTGDNFIWTLFILNL